MSVAPSLAWSYLALLYFAMLGLVLPVCTRARQGTHNLSANEKAQMVALSCAAGLLINYTLGILFADLWIVIVAGSLIAMAGMAWLVWRRTWSLSELFGMGWARSLLVVSTLLIFSSAILLEPLHAWDARSIWFFHAKQIYFPGGLDIASGWTNAAYGFQHAAYPKLLPMLAAEFAYTWGVWNEYIPKASLLMLLGPVVLGLFGLVRTLNLSLAFLLGAFLLVGKEHLWDGMVDVYFALYGGLSLLFLARWLTKQSHLDLVSGIVFLGVALNLKNEGTLLAVCALTGLLLFGILGGRIQRSLTGLKLPACVCVSLLLPLIGFCSWSLMKVHWKLPSDMQLGVESLYRAWERINQGGVGLVSQALLVEGGALAAAGLFLLAVVFARILKTPLAASVGFPAAVGSLYLFGLLLIYLATPYDLRWQLTFSADRTVLTGIVGFFASSFLVLESMETPTFNEAAPIMIAKGHSS